MKNPRHLVEVNIPMHDRDGEEGQGPKDLRPRIRRHLERICKSLGIEYADLVELHISYNRILLVTYDRNEQGELYRDEFNKVATKNERIEVDTYTFVGDEKDI